MVNRGETQAAVNGNVGRVGVLAWGVRRGAWGVGRGGVLRNYAGELDRRRRTTNEAGSLDLVRLQRGY
jgi:hypothetical protein